MDLPSTYALATMSFGSWGLGAIVLTLARFRRLDL